MFSTKHGCSCFWYHRFCSSPCFVCLQPTLIYLTSSTLFRVPSTLWKSYWSKNNNLAILLSTGWLSSLDIQSLHSCELQKPLRMHYDWGEGWRKTRVRQERILVWLLYCMLWLNLHIMAKLPEGTINWHWPHYSSVAHHFWINIFAPQSLGSALWLSVPTTDPKI